MEINDKEITQTDISINAVNDESVVIPIVQEEVLVNIKTVVTGGVRIEKKVNEQEVMLEVPLVQEEVEIKTVPVNRFTDTMPEAVRYEGDTMIIPVLKEVHVVKIMIEKEIHITKRKSSVTSPQSVLLRKEEVTVHNINEAG